jgi:hypothetical protein
VRGYFLAANVRQFTSANTSVNVPPLSIEKWKLLSVILELKQIRSELPAPEFYKTNMLQFRAIWDNKA